MPEASDRRTFLKKSAVAASALAAGCGPKGSMEAEDQRALPAETLRAVGETVLPAELGPRGMGEVLSAFQRWLEEYAPVAELVHGYGSQEIGYGPPHPRPR